MKHWRFLRDLLSLNEPTICLVLNILCMCTLNTRTTVPCWSSHEHLGYSFNKLSAKSKLSQVYHACTQCSHTFAATQSTLQLQYLFWSIIIIINAILNKVVHLFCLIHIRSLKGSVLPLWGGFKVRLPLLPLCTCTVQLLLDLSGCLWRLSYWQQMILVALLSQWVLWRRLFITLRSLSVLRWASWHHAVMITIIDSTIARWWWFSSCICADN